MDSLGNYFNKIFCINLDRRMDRWAYCLEQIEKHNLKNIERFLGIENKENGNRGCTSSHRAILELIVKNGWKRTLILEDDFKIVEANLICNTFQQTFDFMAKFVPDNWDMFYLGGGYAELPIKRINKYVIKHDRMHTTSSYGITYDFAKKIAPTIEGIGPIDTLYCQYHAANNCYILHPRLIVQREGLSDLTNQRSDNGQSMLDPAHNAFIESMKY